MTYRQSFRDQLSIAFDVYLSILRHIQELVDKVLGRDSPDWHIQNDCPACGFKVIGEPVLSPARLHAMDGNNSAKRLHGSGHMDLRTFDSAYLLPPLMVDKFKDEIRPSNPKDADCSDRFKAANAIDNPSALDVFDQTGIFVLSCRHHIVEQIAGMVKSGELCVINIPRFFMRLNFSSAPNMRSLLLTPFSVFLVMIN